MSESQGTTDDSVLTTQEWELLRLEIAAQDAWTDFETKRTETWKAGEWAALAERRWQRARRNRGERRDG